MLGLIVSTVFSGTFITLLLHYVFHFAVPEALFWSFAAMAGAVALNHLTNLTARMLVFWAGSYKDPAKEARVREIIAKHIPAYAVPCDLEIRIVKDDTENAYVLGKNIMGVNTGLLARASEEEIAGVIGHELRHLYYKDSVMASAANAVFYPGLGAMFLLAFLMALGVAWFVSFFDEEGGLGETVLAAFGAAAIGVYLVMIMLFLKSSRTSEYRADAFSARLNEVTRLGLISSLERDRHRAGINRCSLGDVLFSTHPAPKDRIARLKGMAV